MLFLPVGSSSDIDLSLSSTVRSRRATSTYQVSPISPPPQPLPTSESKAKTPKKKDKQDSSTKRKITHESKMGSSAAKRQKVEKFGEDTPTPSFHSSQTQNALPSSLLSFNRRIPEGSLGPLSGYSEFFLRTFFLYSRYGNTSKLRGPQSFFIAPLLRTPLRKLRNSVSDLGNAVN
jgi:hypothetical protein